MSEPAKSDRMAESTDKDHTQVLDMLNSAEMQTRLEEARARREKVLAERASATHEEPPRPAIVQAAAAARMVDAGRTPLLLVEPMRKPPLRQVLPRQGTAKPVPQLAASRPEPVASRPEPVALRAEPVVLRAEPVEQRPEPVASRPEPAALRPEPAPQRRRRFQPSGLVMGLAFGVAAGAGLMQFMWPETPRRPVVPGTDQASAQSETPEEPSAAVAGSSEVEPSGSDQAVIPRARPDKRPDVGLIVLPKVASTEAALPDAITPPADSRPEVVAATAEVVPTTPPARIPPLVTLHLSSDLPDDALADVRSELREAGTSLAATRVAGFGVAKSEVRFFHERDAEDARRIAERMGTVARDFSTYRPVPPPGTLEVWLAGSG